MTSQSYQLPPPPASRAVTSLMAKVVPLPKNLSVAGQTAILTGGNTGLGLACARQLLQRQVARLILPVRTVSKGEAVAVDLRKEFPLAVVEVWPLDMLSYKSMDQFAAKCETLDRIDMAILNAGMTDEKFVMGPEGHEKIYQTNYLSTVYLAHILLPTLKARAPAGKPSRLTIVNSGTAYIARLPRRDTKPFLATFDAEGSWDPVETYSASKALAHFWIFKLADKVRREDVVVNLVDPGLCSGTSLHRDMTGFNKLVFALIKPVAGRSAEAGASTYIHAAVAAGPESHGSYLMDWRISP